MKTTQIILVGIVLIVLYSLMSKDDSLKDKDISNANILDYEPVPKNKPTEPVFNGVITGSEKAETESKATVVVEPIKTPLPYAPEIIISYHEPIPREKIIEPVFIPNPITPVKLNEPISIGSFITGMIKPAPLKQLSIQQ